MPKSIALIAGQKADLKSTFRKRLTGTKTLKQVSPNVKHPVMLASRPMATKKTTFV